MKEPTFLLALAIAGMTLIVVVRSIAGAIAGRRGSRAEHSELTELKEQLDQVTEESANTAAQLADVQNRLDFAERLLAQNRERSALRAGPRGGDDRDDDKK